MSDSLTKQINTISSITHLYDFLFGKFIAMHAPLLMTSPTSTFFNNIFKYFITGERGGWGGGGGGGEALTSDATVHRVTEQIDPHTHTKWRWENKVPTLSVCNRQKASNDLESLD